MNLVLKPLLAGICLLSCAGAVAQSLEIPPPAYSEASVYRFQFGNSGSSSETGGEEEEAPAEEASPIIVQEEDTSEDGMGDWGIEPASPSPFECWPDYNAANDSVVLMTPSLSIYCNFYYSSFAYTVQQSQDFVMSFNLQEVRGSTSSAFFTVDNLFYWQYSSQPFEYGIISRGIDGVNTMVDSPTISVTERDYTNFRIESFNNQLSLYVNDNLELTVPYYRISPVGLDIWTGMARSNLLFENFTFVATQVEN